MFHFSDGNTTHHPIVHLIVSLHIVIAYGEFLSPLYCASAFITATGASMARYCCVIYSDVLCHFSNARYILIIILLLAVPASYVTLPFRPRGE